MGMHDNSRLAALPEHLPVDRGRPLPPPSRSSWACSQRQSMLMMLFIFTVTIAAGKAHGSAIPGQYVVLFQDDKVQSLDQGLRRCGLAQH